MTLKVLRDYQVDDLGFYIANDRWMNLSDPGCGKTGSVCVFLEFLWTHRQCKTAWAQPKSLLNKNKEEIHEFTNLKDDEVVIIDGTPKQRQKQMESPNAKVFLMGFTRYADDWETLLALHPEINATIIDEVHMGFKGHKSKRTKSLMRSMRKIKYFGVMSGTLIDGRLDTCYPSIHIIEPRYYASHFAFMMQHGIMDDMGNVVMWTAHDKLGRIFQKHSVRHKFDDVYGKQKYVVIVDWCEMHPKQKKAYDEFERDAVLELDEFLDNIQNDVLDGTEPGVKTIRCRQIMSHPETFKILNDKEITGKDEQLLVHVEDHKNTGQPLLVYAVLQPEQERLAILLEKQGLRVGLINGNTPSKKRNEYDIQFRKGELDVIVGSPETCAVGYNWGHIDHVIFASIDYKNTNFTQGLRRAIRGKRAKPLRVTVLAYNNRVEKSTFHIVNAKSKHLNKVDSSYEVLTIGEDQYKKGLKDEDT